MSEAWTVVSIHRQDTGPGRVGCVSLEVLGGPKKYMRIWDGMFGDPEWGWVLSPFNRQIYPPITGTAQPFGASNPQQPPNGESQ